MSERKIAYLPLPPSANRYWRVFRGRPVKSKMAVEYAEHVAEFAGEHGVTMHTGPVSLTITVHPERPKDWQKRAKKDPLWALSVRRLDLDNHGKVLLDALQGVAYVDDKQITAYSVMLGQPIEGGGVVVDVCPDTNWRTE